METLFALAFATAILVSIPGPNVALIVANSLRFGLQAGCMTVMGTTSGVALQLLFVVIGMAVVIEAAAAALYWVKWAGVIYLVWLGVRTWFTPAGDPDAVEASPTEFWRAFLIAAINPKTLLFNAAFLPQFVAGDAAAAEVLLLAGVFLAVLTIGDLLWATFASSARSVLKRYSRHQNRLAGTFYVAAGTVLASYESSD